SPAAAVGGTVPPASDYRPANWARREKILDITHQQLRDRLANDGIAGVKGALQRLWPHFADRPGDLADPLNYHLQAAPIREPPPDQRPPPLSGLMQQAWLSPRSAEAMAGLQRALVEWRALGPAEAFLILPALPDEVPVAPEVIDTALDEIERVAAQPTAKALDALRVLYSRRIAP